MFDAGGEVFWGMKLAKRFEVIERCIGQCMSFMFIMLETILNSRSCLTEVDGVETVKNMIPQIPAQRTSIPTVIT